MLQISDLKVSSDEKEILKGVTFEVGNNEVHSLMGQNGSGKSTLAQTVMGNPQYTVNGGNLTFDNKNVLTLTPDERALSGIFLSFQYPSEIPGVTVASYLRMIYNKSHGTKLSPVAFRKTIKSKLELLHMKEDFLSRSLNENFSGGEKKRMEMLQMLVLEPKLAILDEVDSGLDIDALKIISEAVNYLRKEKGMSVLLITHYARILKYIEPDHVHIMKEGRIVRSGTKDLAHQLEEKGYDILSE